MRVLEITRGVVPEDSTKRPYLDLSAYLNEDGTLSGDLVTSAGPRRIPQYCVIQKPERLFAVSDDLRKQTQYLRATDHPNQIVVTLRDSQFEVCCSFLQSQLRKDSDLADAISDLILHIAKLSDPDYKADPKTDAEERASALHRKFALHEAVLGCDTALIDEIVQLHPEQLHLENGNGFTPLEQAVWTGSSEAVKRLLEHGADIGVTDAYGQTPLHVACIAGSTEKVKILVEHGADINAATKDGSRPVHFAMMANRKELLCYLKEKGVVLNQADEETRKARKIGEQWKGQL